jgi:hypothetical protein
MFLTREPNVTVEEYMWECLSVHLDGYDVKQECLNYVMKNANGQPLVNNKNKSIPVKDCWDTNIADYTDESVMWLWIAVSSSALKWCGNKINSME